MTRALAAAGLTVAVCVVASACGPALMKLPTGAALPVSSADATMALAEATSGCAAVRTMTAEIAVRGGVAGRRVRGRLLAGVERPSSVRLEAVAPFGPPVFIFTARGDDASLLLPRDDRVLEHGQPAGLLDAVAGIPLGSDDLASTLTGCVPSGINLSANAKGFGDSWLVLEDPAGDEMYLRREAARSPWQLAATVRRGGGAAGRWRAEYDERQGNIPRSIRLISVDADGRTGRAFDLRMTLSQIERDVPLDASVFEISIPPAALPITVDELRRSGPLAASDGR
jgi:hypothetical protein